MTPRLKQPPKARWRTAARRRMVATPAWRRLTDPGPDALTSGVLFRFPARWPYEHTVDYHLTFYEDQGLAFIVASGIKVGAISLILPDEAYAGADAISRRWLTDNWEYWVYPNCAARDVFLRDGA